MRPRDYLPIALLGGVAVFVVMQGTRTRRAAPKPAAPVPAVAEEAGTTVPRPADSATPMAPTSATQQGAADSGLVEVREAVAAPAPERDPAMIKEVITAGSPGTYLMSILKEQGQFLSRWPERRMDALRVWIDRYPGLPDFSASYPVVAEQVFDEWQQAGFPLRFDFVSDASKAEIRIRWASTLPQGENVRIGTTEKVRDRHGWIVGADIVITTHDRASGKPFPPELVAGIARHEVGHALGLGHSDNKADVMYPESTTPIISRADRATLHLLYILPPGMVPQ